MSAWRYLGAAVNRFLTLIGVLLTIVALLPLDRLIQGDLLALTIRVASGVVLVGLMLFYLPYRAVREIDERASRDFYAMNPDARADRAHRVLGRLLRDSYDLPSEKAEPRRDALVRWDKRVRLALVEHCTPDQAQLYWSETRDYSVRSGDLPIADYRLGEAQERLLMVLRELERAPMAILRTGT
jgi:hypothetical protein